MAGGVSAPRCARFTLFRGPWIASRSCGFMWDARCGPSSHGRGVSCPIRCLPGSACGPTRPGATRWRATRRSMRHRRGARWSRGRGRPRPTSAWWSSCPSRSHTRAASPASMRRSDRSWRRSSHSGREPTPSGSSCRGRSLRPTSAPWPGFSAGSPARTGTPSRSATARSSTTCAPYGFSKGCSPVSAPSGCPSTPRPSSGAPDQRHRTRGVVEEAAHAAPVGRPHRPSDRPLPRPGRHGEHDRGLAALDRHGHRLAARRPLADRVHPHPDNADALTLARRFHDDVRALLPEVEPLPEPMPTEPLTLF